MKQDEEIKIEADNDPKMFTITRVITEQIPAKEMIEVIKQIREGMANAEKQRDQSQESFDILRKRLSSFASVEDTAKRWIEEQKPTEPTH